MTRALAFLAILCGCLLLFGVLSAPAADRLGVRAFTQPRLVTVIVTLHDARWGYRWLSVHGCAAEVGESGTFCTGLWERESTMELTGGQKQHLVDWRDLPRGTMLVTALAFGDDQRLLARGQLTVFRGE